MTMRGEWGPLRRWVSHDTCVSEVSMHALQ